MAAIGIDLGLDSSCVAVCLNGQVKVIPSDIGNKTTPSCVAFSDTHCFVGDAAFHQAAFNPSNTIFGSRMLIGRKFDDEAVQRYINRYTLNVVPSLGPYSDKKPMIVVSYKGKKREFEAVEIFAMILKKLKEDAEAYLDKEVKNVVVTVPVSFNYLQRQATKDAGVIAGLNIMRVIDEPTAAAMACCLGKKAADRTKYVLIFGLGRETCEVSLVEIGKDAYKVKSTSENNTLGGQNFGNRLANFLVCEFKKKHGKAIRRYRVSRLRAACERAKVSHSLSYEVTVEINFLGIDYQFTLTRARFKNLNYDLLRHCVSFINKCLDNAKMTKEDVDEVVFIGGGSSIPIIQQVLKEFFGEAMCSNIHPEEGVAIGAALHAATIACTRPRQTTDIPLLLEDVDCLLNGFGDSKPVKPVTSFMKHTIAEVLNRLKLDCSNIRLMESLFMLVRRIDISLPGNLRPALEGLEQTLFACQQQFLEKASEKEACFIDPQEVTSMKADLTTSKKKIQLSSSCCNKLKEDIADIDVLIARLMDQRSSLESDLSFEQLNLAGLTDSLNTQMESAKKRLDRFSSFQAAEQLEDEARHSLGAALDCLGSFLASL